MNPVFDKRYCVEETPKYAIPASAEEPIHLSGTDNHTSSVLVILFLHVFAGFTKLTFR